MTRHMGDPLTFDLLGPLPAANTTTVLEASAGTGKTFALAGLVTRYLAEGVATLDEMLLITFSRAASSTAPTAAQPPAMTKASMRTRLTRIPESRAAFSLPPIA